MDIGGEEDDELAGAEADVAQVVSWYREKGNVFFFVIGDGRLLTGEGCVAEFFGAGDHDLDVGVVPVTLGIAFFQGFGSIFIDDGEDVVAVDVMPADGKGGEVGGQGKVDGFGEVGTDGFVPGQLRKRGGDHRVKLGRF